MEKQSTEIKVFPFEKKVIDLILNTIKDNQVYLTQKENLPQLAKLGYMYNTLWYAGRVAWGSDGTLLPNGVMTYQKSKKNKNVKDEDVYWGQCEDNPKYKIEMCEPENEEIENLIYDAWGMHVENELCISWDEFSTIVLKGRPYSEFELRALKPNKTFDEWVDMLTNPEYLYSSMYPDRRSVANHMLCVIGNGYGYKDGFVIYEAGGADQDIDSYGQWENCTFKMGIQMVVNEIMAMPEVKQTIDAYHEISSFYKKQREDEDKKAFGGKTFKEFCKTKKYKKLMRVLGDGEQEQYSPYYPICGYSIISKLGKKSHPSYIKAGIEICEEILAHPKEESERPENLKFAEKFLEKFKK